MSIALEKHISWRSAEAVTEIANPLFNNLKLNYFTYGRYYQDGSFSVLYSDRDCVHACLNDDEYQAPGLIRDAGIYSWEEYIPTRALTFLKTEFNHQDGITILKEGHGFKEQFSFCGGFEAPKSLDLYFSQRELLEQFQFYFKDQASDLITAMDKDRIITSATACEPQPDNTSLLSQIQPQKYHLITVNGEVALSPREYQCFRLLLQLKTSKQSAHLLDISHRTVEFHIKNLTKKLGCYHKSDFFDIARLNGLV